MSNFILDIFIHIKISKTNFFHLRYFMCTKIAKSTRRKTLLFFRRFVAFCAFLLRCFHARLRLFLFAYVLFMLFMLALRLSFLFILFMLALRVSFLFAYVLFMLFMLVRSFFKRYKTSQIPSFTILLTSL